MDLVPTILEQTGWSGSKPDMLCPHWATLVCVTAWDYPLTDPGFRDYWQSTSVRNLFPSDSLTRQFMLDHTLLRDQFLAEGYEDAPHRKRYSTYELGLAWRRVLAARGALQDAWEVYSFRR